MADADHITVPLIDGYHVLIDADMAHLLERYTWRYHKCGRKRYVQSGTRNKGKRVRLVLHQIILGDIGPGQVCDHINGNTLDNRRCNLRAATLQQNAFNAAKKPSKHGNRFKGISTRPYGYAAQIRADGKIKNLGTYRTDVEAAYAYDMASLEHHGEFGRRNFLPLIK